MEEEEEPVSEIIAEYDDEDLIELVELAEYSCCEQHISLMNNEEIDLQLEIIEPCIFEMNKRSIDSTKLIAIEEKLVKKRKNEL